MPTTTARRPAPRRNSMPSTLLVLVVATAALVLLVVAVAAGSGSSSRPRATHTVDVAMGEFWFEPATIEVPAGTELIVRASNAGQQTHDLKLGNGRGTGFLLDGEREEVNLGVIDEDTRAWCTVPGHLEAGMVLEIVVTR